MTSKQRVNAALNRQPVDRVPVFMWFHPSTTRRLAALLEIPPGKVGEAMGNDIVQAWVNNNHAMEGIVHERDGESHVDDWGITWTKEGEYNQVTHYPLAGLDRDAVLAYEFPNRAQEALLANMNRVMPYADDFYVGVDVSPCVYEMYWRLRGMDYALLDLVADPELADAMLGRCADFAVELSVKALDRFAVDWLWTGDDVAGQQSMMMSPDCWRDLVRPHLQRVVDVGKAKGL
ncbi:MAG: hypothetical protein KJ060_21990, partial [Candidatus Hydrogenedentes bacterium]|nr:hypothetical protein [Candidatus Hydrogenedentota bacterium]